MTDRSYEGSVEVVLVAHGSPDARHGRGIASLAEAVRQECSYPVHTAYLEHQSPRPQQVAEALTAAVVIVVPLLLAAGYHAREDIPEVTRQLGVGRISHATDVLGETAAVAAAEELAGDRVGRLILLDDRGHEIVVRDGDLPTLAIARTLCSGILADKVADLAAQRGYAVLPGQLAATAAIRSRVLQLIGNAVSDLGG